MTKWQDLCDLLICVWGEIIYRIMWGTASFNQDEQKYGTLTYKERLEWTRTVLGEADPLMTEKIDRELKRITRKRWYEYTPFNSS